MYNINMNRIDYRIKHIAEYIQFIKCYIPTQNNILDKYEIKQILIQLEVPLCNKAIKMMMQQINNAR